MYHFDTETCGFHGPIVLIQVIEDDGDVFLHEMWRTPIHDTLSLIEDLCDNDVMAFNLAFDWFHICQAYTTLLLHPNKTKPPVIETYANLESEARFGPCLKPKGAFDVMLHARKGPYQSTMPRDALKVKKVPTALAWKLQAELNDRIKLPDIYFEKRADKTVRWQIFDIHDDFGDVNPDFKDLILKFSPSSQLKALAKDALKLEDDFILKFTDIEVNPIFRPEEDGYAPFYPHSNWPEVIQRHINHWAFNRLGREYAAKDPWYVKALYEHFGKPEINDHDSILACAIAAARWRGYAIDVPALKELRDKQVEIVNGVNKKYDANFNSPETCRRFLTQVLSETEATVLKVNDKITTKGVVLEEIAKWKNQDVCPTCEGLGCTQCENGLVNLDTEHPAAARAQMILDFRHANKEIELFDKLIKAGRLHADFNIIGARSSRMSGSGGLNAQGIKREKAVRRCFPLADGVMVLCGGDFEGFEVCLAEAVYDDEALREDLFSGKKFHALLGVFFFPELTYEGILSTKGLPGDKDKYGRSKNGSFALFYGGDGNTLQNRVGITAEAAEKAYNMFIKKYVKVGEARVRTFNRFCSMRQPGGIGSRVVWHEPADYMESMFGFKRYFTLENQICKALYDLGENPPEDWKKLKIKVVRRDREQTVEGAVRSALFAAAFAIQASNMRAACNHEIQSSGAQLNKFLQCEIWALQPSGINQWRVQPMNIHDELMCPADPSILDDISKVVSDFVKKYKARVPLLGIDWSKRLKNWAEK